MHPAIHQFRRDRPRTYGLILLTVSLVVGLIRHFLALDGLDFVLFFLTVVFGGTGMVYLLMGSQCNRWDRAFNATFNPSRLTWRQAIGFTVFGLGLLGFSIVLYSGLR